jgi:hypothetical protein
MPAARTWKVDAPYIGLIQTTLRTRRLSCAISRAMLAASPLS